MDDKVILVVEDDGGNQFLMSMMIRKSNDNIAIVQAHDGREALDIINSSERRPNLIFLDLNMTGMNGFDFLESLHEQTEGSDLPPICVVTSSNSDQDKERACKFEGVKEYLVKPIEQADIDRLIA